MADQLPAERERESVRIEVKRERIRAACFHCRTPRQSGTRNGYTCPDHWPVLYGIEMPTLGDPP